MIIDYEWRILRNFMTIRISNDDAYFGSHRHGYYRDHSKDWYECFLFEGRPVHHWIDFLDPRFENVHFRFDKEVIKINFELCIRSKIFFHCLERLSDRMSDDEVIASTTIACSSDFMR